MEGTQEFYYIGQAILKLEFFCLPSSQIIACTTSLTGKVKEKNLDPLKNKTKLVPLKGSRWPAIAVNS